MSDAGADQNQNQEPVMARENLISLTGIAVGMGVVSFISFYYESFFLIPSLASSAIMLFLSYNNVFAQPRNVLGGHLMSALAAVVVLQFGDPHWWSIAVVVVLAAVLMMVSHTVHPPGGGTAIAAYLCHYLPSQIFGAVFLGCVVMILVAVLLNNASPHRKYPLFWI